MIISMTVFLIQCYTETEMIDLMQGQIGQYPETQLVESSHRSTVAHSSLVI
jgi:hypothetical protein